MLTTLPTPAVARKASSPCCSTSQHVLSGRLPASVDPGLWCRGAAEEAARVEVAGGTPRAALGVAAVETELGALLVEDAEVRARMGVTTQRGTGCSAQGTVQSRCK